MFVEHVSRFQMDASQGSEQGLMMTLLADLMALVGSAPSDKRYEFDPGDVDSLEAHLSETISWLLNSTRFSKDSCGSAQSYRLFRGWSRSFPETTGYIIPTLLDYSKFAHSNQTELRNCAVSLGEWLMSIQLESGACMGGLYGTNPKPSLFNTGQNLLGFYRLYEETHDDRFLQAAIRSADFILGCQDDTGAYVRHLYSAIVACYNVRSAWAILKLGVALGSEKYISSALKNIQWTMSQQKPNGWFSNNTFSLKKNTNTHSIAYVLEGLIESYALVRHEEILDAAVRTAEGILSRYESRGWISGEHDSNFTYLRPYTCVTGNLQLAGVWLKIYSLRGEPRYLQGASNIVQWYLKYHNIRTKNPGIRGGVHGSIPHWGRYAPLKYPNWAAKFFCDTLMALIPHFERARKTTDKERAHLVIPDSSSVETFRDSIMKLEQYMRDHHYEGYDPYDGLTSPVLRLALLRSMKWPRLAIQQVLKRIPINVRPILFIRQGRNPVTFGLSLQAYTELIQALPGEMGFFHRQAIFCLDEIEKLQSTGYSGACWGYDFDWEARYARIPAFTPTVVATGIITNALFLHYQLTGNSHSFDMCRSATKFVTTDLFKTRKDSTFCYSYSPLDREVVFNAAMKGARLLAQVYSVTGDTKLIDEARATVQFVIQHQREDGAWSYSAGDARTWVDNFHTGYVLDCLDEYIKLSGDQEFEPHLARGLQYYQSHFFEKGEIPKYYDASVYPIDSTAAAQSILTLCRFRKYDIASRVANWTVRIMQDPEGYFYYQRHRHYTIRIPYMRWSNAWMFAALATLLKDVSSARLTEIR